LSDVTVLRVACTAYPGPSGKYCKDYTFPGRSRDKQRVDREPKEEKRKQDLSAGETVKRSRDELHALDSIKNY